ncbi:MAG: hypothetical protein WD010_07985 [Nitriliruptor sp.]|uniref:hypothetical protein n=1 Tax=Nitriliruptor sp. TaxID=2448056 RepID=UPI00349FDA7E
MSDDSDLTVNDLEAFWEEGEEVDVTNLATRPVKLLAAPWTGPFSDNQSVAPIRSSQVSVSGS